MRNKVFAMICALVVLLLSMNTILFSSEQQKVALVLSGGGAKGLAHVGLLKVIDELGIEVDAIYGTSIGAIIGGMYASGLSAVEIEEILVNLDWSYLMSDQVSRRDLYTGQKKWLPTGNYFFPIDDDFVPRLPRGMILGNHIHLRLFYETWHQSHITDFSQLPIPFKCVATDLETGELVLFESGSIADAMRASSTMSSIFVPFESNDRLLVDGGIVQNFPADIAKSDGNDFIIGMKTNTEMSPRDELKNTFNILNQTLNIGMQHRQSIAEQYVDILISPAVDEFAMMDFANARQIINAGYTEALKHTEELRAIALNTKTTKQIDILPEKIKFSRIEIKGNTYLTTTQIKDYLRLNTDAYYGRDEILRAFKNAFASELFDQIYPNIKKTDTDEYILAVILRERERKHIAINMTYNEHDQFTAGTIIRMRNVLLKESDMWLNIQAGGVFAVEMDYSKAFLKDNNVYYRLFPYFREDKIYIYNKTEGHSDSRYKRTEFGLTAGVGIQSTLNTIIEPYLYTYQVIFDKDIAREDLYEENDRVFISSGVGAKLYYETLNDYPFYTKGVQLFSKFSASTINEVSNLGHNKFYTSMVYAQPITKKASAIISGEYGSYLRGEIIQQDPFYIGGIDSFLGLKPREESAPFYRKVAFDVRLNPTNNLFVDLKTNYLTYGFADSWIHMDDVIYAAGIVVGYKTFVGPHRIGFALNDRNETSFYLSIGYDYDAFFFSRR